jgi:hypothetical protein
MKKYTTICLFLFALSVLPALAETQMGSIMILGNSVPMSLEAIPHSMGNCGINPCYPIGTVVTIRTGDNRKYTWVGCDTSGNDDAEDVFEGMPLLAAEPAFLGVVRARPCIWFVH